MIEKPSTAGGVASRSPAEAALLAAFHATADDYRETAISMLEVLARRFPRHRPALTLVRAAGAAVRKENSDAKS